MFSAASKELDLRDKLPKKRSSVLERLGPPNVLERLGPPVKMSMTDGATSFDGQGSQDTSWNIPGNIPIVQNPIPNDIQDKPASLMEAVAVLGAVVGTAAQQMQEQIQYPTHLSFQPPSQNLGQGAIVNPFYDNVLVPQSTIDPGLEREREAFLKRSEEVPQFSIDPGLERERDAFLKRSEVYAKRKERREEKQKEMLQEEANFKPRWGHSDHKEKQAIKTEEKDKKEDLRNKLAKQAPLAAVIHGNAEANAEMSSLSELRSLVEQREDVEREKEEKIRRLAEEERALQLKREEAKEELRLRDAEEEEGWRLQLQAEQRLRAAEELKKQAEEMKREEELRVRQEEEAHEITQDMLQRQHEDDRQRRQGTERKATEERKKPEEVMKLNREVEERLRKQREHDIKQAEIQRLRDSAEQMRLKEERQKQEMERVARLEKERQQEEIWRREEAERREAERRVAAEREEVERLRRVVEEKEQQRMAHEQYLRAEENRRRQEMAAQQFVAEQRRKEALETDERRRRAAAEEQHRLEYEHMMEERRMLLHRRQQLDILERQQQDELRFRQGNALQEAGTDQGYVNPLYSNCHNTGGRGAPRGRGLRGIGMPPPPSGRQREGFSEADGDIVNPLYSNFHTARGRGAPRGRGVGMPPPTNVPPPHMYPSRMPPPPNMPPPSSTATPALQTAGWVRGSDGRFDGCGYLGSGGGGRVNYHNVAPQFEPPPPGEDLGEAASGKRMPIQGRAGDWECGYCGNINFAREETMFKTFYLLQSELITYCIFIYWQ